VPVRRCLEPGCGQLSKQSRCPKHRKQHEQERRGGLTGWEWSAIKKRIKRRDGYRCTECGSSIDLEVDHEVALEEGGTNDDENLRTRCRPCHLRRHGKSQQ
jgi:5-methylcytosine-specific restriction protein A